MDRKIVSRMIRRYGLWGGAVLIVLGTLFFFLTRTWPLMKQLHSLRQVVKQLEQEIQTEMGQLQVRNDLGRAIISLQEEAEALRRKFPYREEKVIKTFREIAQQHQVSLESMIVSGKYDYKPKSGQLPSGVALQYIVLDVRANATYGHLVRFLSELNESLPTYMNVERLILRRQPGTLNSLAAEMTLVFYVSKP